MLNIIFLRRYLGLVKLDENINASGEKSLTVKKHMILILDLV